MNEDNLQNHNFNSHGLTVIEIIGKYYPHIKDEKELSLLECIADTMKDFGWSVADAPEVKARMTEDPMLEESNYFKYVDAVTSRKLLQPDEYKHILSHLINKKIVQLEIIPTIFGSPHGERLEDYEYLKFINHNIINEIWRNA